MTEEKLIVFIAQSLDGYIAGPNGEIDWLDIIPNPDGDDMGYFALMAEVDALLMGRKTYDFVAGYDGPWPYDIPVYVLSSTLKEIPERLKEKAFLLDAHDPLTAVSEIRAAGHSGIYVDGGRLIQSLLVEDVIDELRITTLPILLGAGAPLFGALDRRLEWRLTQSSVYLGQLVQSHYVRFTHDN